MVYAQLVGRWIIRKGAGIYTYVGWHRHCTSESRSILEHLGSLLASRIYCPAVPSGHWSSVTVQTSRASTECSHWADCIAYLTLRFRASLGIWAREREKAYVRSSPNWRLNSRLEKNELPKAEILQREFSQSDVWHCPVCLFSSWPKGQLHIVS